MVWAVLLYTMEFFYYCIISAPTKTFFHLFNNYKRHVYRYWMSILAIGINILNITFILYPISYYKIYSLIDKLHFSIFAISKMIFIDIF